MAGALTLADVRTELIRMACRRCERRGQYRRTTLIALYGGKAALPNVLAQLANDCPMRDTIGDKACGAYFLDLVGRPPAAPDAPRRVQTQLAIQAALCALSRDQFENRVDHRRCGLGRHAKLAMKRNLDYALSVSHNPRRNKMK